MFFKKRTITLILSCARSGSTLLKALLAEAEDISHLPEYNFLKYRNSDIFYHNVCKLTKKRIIILKKPFWFDDIDCDWEVPKSNNLKIIVLVRDVQGVVESLMKTPINKEYVNLLKYPVINVENLIKYWCDVYEKIFLKIKKIKKKNMYYLKYEDLVLNPVRETRKMYKFLGSSRKDGMDRYHEPKHFKWEWGSDDGGDKIKICRVVYSEPCRKNMEIVKKTKLNDRVYLLRKKMGYL